MGGTYIEGIVGQPTTINPVLVSTNEIDKDLSILFFSGLTVLSSKISHDNAGKTWTVNLKPGIKWSDGESITSADVLFTINSIADIDLRSPLMNTWRGVVAEAITDTEIHFTLKTPYVFFEKNLENLRIIPKHIFGTIPAVNMRLSNYNLEPIGSGPYRFVRYEKRKDGFITDYYTEPNPFYANEHALLANLQFKFFTQNEEAHSAFTERTINGLPGIDAVKAKEWSETQNIIDIPAERYYAIFINQALHKALKNNVVRKALTLSIDRAQIVKQIFHQYARPIMNTSINELAEPQEIRTAEKILDEDGWVLNEAGIREKIIDKEKVRLEFDIVVPQIEFLVKTADTIKTMWSRIGVKLNLTHVDAQRIAEEILKTRTYQMVLFGNIIRNREDILPFWHSSERFYPGLNLALYENRAVDDLLEKTRIEFNPEKRALLLTKIYEYIQKDTPAIFLYSPNYLYATNKKILGWSEDTVTTSGDRFKQIEKWHLSTTRT